MRHPNIIAFYGACIEPLFFVTEFAAKGDLHTYLVENKAQLTWPKLLSFAYAIDAPVHTFRQNVKPLDVSLNVAFDELLQALFHFDIVTKRNLIPVSRVSDLKKQGDVLATMLNAPEIKKQQSNRNN